MKKFKSKVIVSIVIIFFLIFIFLLCFFLNLRNTYNEIEKELFEKSYKNAYEKISYIYKINPNYKSTKELYKSIKYKYFIDLVIKSIQQKKYQDAINYLDEADTGYASQNEIVGFTSLINCFKQLDEIEFLSQKTDYKNALKKFKNIKHQEFKIIFQKDFVQIKNKDNIIYTYNTFLKHIKDLEKEINHLFNIQKARYSYLESKMIIEEDKIDDFVIIKHPNNIMGNYLDTLALCIISDEDNVDKLSFFYNHPDKEWLYFDKIIFNIDGVKKEIYILDKIVHRNYREIPFLNTTILTETLFLTEEYLQNDIFYYATQIPNSYHSYIRLKGKNRKFDREITNEEKEAIAEIYEYYLLRKVL